MLRIPWILVVGGLVALSGLAAPRTADGYGSALRQVAREPFEAGARPRLCVLIAVDQMIPEQLERLAPWLEGGLGRLAREGFVFRQAMLPFAVTETGPGHVSLATGRSPAEHGVIANQWIDPESGRGVYCVEDAWARYVSDSGPAERAGARSWRNVRVPALGDHLRGSFPGARVVSIGGKDRSAVGLGGARGEVVLWWDRSRGGFQTSDAYQPELPGWVAAWNAGWVERVPATWEPLIDAPLAGSGTYLGLRDGSPSRGGRGTLPQTLPVPDLASLEDETARGARARLARTVFATPFLDDFVLELAGRAVDELALGAAAERVDLLALGLSACDVVGHGFGPYSFEVTDLLLRLDRGLERLFALLDERLGREGWICVLSADHGVLELPEELVRRGIGARRVDGPEVARAMQSIAAALRDELGAERATLRSEAGGLYLGRAELRGPDIDLSRAREVARDALLAAAPWVARAWTREELLCADPATADPWLTLALASYDPERGPDVPYHLRPWHLLGSSSGTSHGSPYPYDRRVPLVFLGPGLAPGTSHDPVTILDAVPTILAWLGLEVPAELEGEVR